MLLLIVWSVKKQTVKSKGCENKKRKNNAYIKLAVCVSKILIFIKEQEASGLLSSL